jgi:hypothetical protein
MLVGGILTGAAAGFFSYYPTRWIATCYQKTRGRHRHRRSTWHTATCSAAVQTMPHAQPADRARQSKPTSRKAA